MIVNFKGKNYQICKYLTYLKSVKIHSHLDIVKSAVSFKFSNTTNWRNTIIPKLFFNHATLKCEITPLL